MAGFGKGRHGIRYSGASNRTPGTRWEGTRCGDRFTVLLRFVVVQYYVSLLSFVILL